MALKPVAEIKDLPSILIAKRTQCGVKAFD